MKRAVDITRLKEGTTLLIETNNVYEIVILDPSTKLVTIVGGGERFPRAEEAMLVGAVWGKDVLPGWIEIGMAIEIIPKKTPTHLITTGAVKSVKIIGHDHTFKFEL